MRARGDVRPAARARRQPGRRHHLRRRRDCGRSRPGKAGTRCSRLVRATCSARCSGGRRPTSASCSSAAARVVRRRSLVVLISDFISEPGWERPLLRLTERHEVVAVRLVDPREYELPDAGLLFVEDAETGEQLLVDSSDPELRRRLLAVAEEQDEAIRHGVAQARADPPRRVDRGRPRERVRADGRRAAEAAQMTFASPEWLLGLAAPPGRGGRATCRRGAGDGDERPPSPRRASSRPARRRRRRWRAARAVRAVPGRARPPRRRFRPADGDDQDAATRSNGGPRYRRLQQHGRHRRQALPHRCGQGRRRGLRPRAAVRVSGSGSSPSARAP